MTEEFAIRENRVAWTASGVGPATNRAVRRVARAIATALGNASEAACAAALRRHARLLEDPPAERRGRPG